MTIRPIDKERYRENHDYRDGAIAGMELIETMNREDALRRGRAGLAWLKNHALGWNGVNGGIYFWRTGWDHLSLGLHICLGAPNIEIHLPFGFIRIGWHADRKHRRELAESADA
jgi:hypothetical protein